MRLAEGILATADIRAQKIVLPRFDAVLEESESWRKVATMLFGALQGTTKRHRLTLASALGEDEPVFDPPAPSIGDNLRAVAEACAAFEKLKPSAESANADLRQDADNAASNVKWNTQISQNHHGEAGGEAPH